MGFFEHWYTIAGTLVLLVGAIATLYKLKPESTKIFVDTARISVELANDQREDLQKQLTALRVEMNELRRAVVASQSEARTAHQRADRLQAQLTIEKGKVTRLQTEAAKLKNEVRVLREELDAHHITPPQVDQTPLDLWNEDNGSNEGG